MNRLARPVLLRPMARPVAPVLARTYISYRPSWADNTPVAPHEWGTKIARFFTRLPEMGWGFVVFWSLVLVLYHKHYVQTYFPEHTNLIDDHYLDNPMQCAHRYTQNTQWEKVESELYGNKNLYHHVYRPEDGVEHGRPWTDKRADLFIKRYFSIANQKMTLENKVDRYMQNSADGSISLGIGPFDFGKTGWTNPRTGKFEPSTTLGLSGPYDGEKPKTENVFYRNIINHFDK